MTLHDATQHDTVAPPAAVSGCLGITRAMHGVMKQVRGVAKDRRNKHHDYLFTGHDDVTDALRSAFVDHGIVPQMSVTGCTRSETELLTMQVSVTLTAVEDGTQVELIGVGEAQMTRSRDGKPSGEDLQAGKAFSYAVKVVLMKTFMLLGGADNEEHDVPRESEQSNGNGKRPSSEPVGDEQIRVYTDSYSSVKTKKELTEIRASVSELLSKLSQEQYRILQVADEDAAVRVDGAS